MQKQPEASGKYTVAVYDSALRFVREHTNQTKADAECRLLEAQRYGFYVATYRNDRMVKGLSNR